MTASIRELADDVWTLLDGIPNVNSFRGEPTIPTYNSGDPDTHRFWDPDARVHGYLVAYFGLGRSFSSRVSDDANMLTWSFQVTCVGGDDNRCLWVIDKVRATLTGLRLRPTTGKLYEVTDPGPMRRDDDAAPPRFYLPLVFALNV